MTEALTKYFYSDETDFDSLDVVLTESGVTTEKFILEFKKPKNTDNLIPDDFLLRVEGQLASILLRNNRVVKIRMSWLYHLGCYVAPFVVYSTLDYESKYIVAA